MTTSEPRWLNTDNRLLLCARNQAIFRWAIPFIPLRWHFVCPLPWGKGRKFHLSVNSSKLTSVPECHPFQECWGSANLQLVRHQEFEQCTSMVEVHVYCTCNTHTKCQLSLGIVQRASPSNFPQHRSIHVTAAVSWVNPCWGKFKGLAH